MPKFDPPPMTVVQAADESGLSRRTIQYAVVRGHLKAHKLPAATGAWLIDRADFDAWFADRKATA